LDLTYYKLTAWGKLIYKTKKFFRNLGCGVRDFVKGVAAAIVSFFRGIGTGLKDFALNFYYGNLLTKSSYFIMGAGHVTRGHAYTHGKPEHGKSDAKACGVFRDRALFDKAHGKQITPLKASAIKYTYCGIPRKMIRDKNTPIKGAMA